MVAPEAGQPVNQRHRRVRILEDVEHREVGRHVTCSERAERNRNEGELRQRRRRRHAHEHRIIAARANDRHAALDQGQPERQHQRVMAELGDHLPAPPARIAADGP